MASAFCERCGGSAVPPASLKGDYWLSAYMLGIESPYHVTASFNITTAPGRPHPILCVKCLHELVKQGLDKLRAEHVIRADADPDPYIG